MIRSALWILLIVSLLAAGKPDFQFYGETISVSVDKSSYVRVKGDYYFRNNSSQKIVRKLYYPVPLDSIQQCPDSFTIIQDQQKETLPAATKDGVYFTVSLDANSTCTTTVLYNQRVEHSQFRYILMTTHTWNSSLNNSNYHVDISDKLQLLWLSYPADSIELKDGKQFFSFYRDDFSPHEDLIIRWE